MLKTNFAQLMALSETTQKDRVFKEGYTIKDDIKEQILKMKVSDIIGIPEERINELMSNTEISAYLQNISIKPDLFDIARAIMYELMSYLQSADPKDIFSEMMSANNSTEVSQQYVETRLLLNFVPVKDIQWFHSSLSKAHGEAKEKCNNPNKQSEQKSE